MLCHAVRVLLERRAITPDAILSLEASGGECDDEMVNRVMETHTEADLDAFLADFPTSIFVDREHNIDDVSDEDPYENPPSLTFREKAAMKCVS